MYSYWYTQMHTKTRITRQTHFHVCISVTVLSMTLQFVLTCFDHRVRGTQKQRIIFGVIFTEVGMKWEKWCNPNADHTHANTCSHTCVMCVQMATRFSIDWEWTKTKVYDTSLSHSTVCRLHSLEEHSLVHANNKKDLGLSGTFSISNDNDHFQWLTWPREPTDNEGKGNVMRKLWDGETERFSGISELKKYTF